MHVPGLVILVALIVVALLGDWALGRDLAEQQRTDGGGFGGRSSWGPTVGLGAVALLAVGAAMVSLSSALSRWSLRSRLASSSGFGAGVRFGSGLLLSTAVSAFAVGSLMWLVRGDIELRRSGRPYYESRNTRLGESVNNVVWHLADSIPGADTTELLLWDKPAEYGHWVGGALLLVAKVLVVAPMLVAAKEAWKARAPREYSPGNPTQVTRSNPSDSMPTGIGARP